MNDAHRVPDNEQQYIYKKHETQQTHRTIQKNTKQRTTHNDQRATSNDQQTITNASHATSDTH